ncbi:MAG: ATP-binding protein [Candidatus Acetothermia bacterium]
MFELSLHILDIGENSLRAEANSIEIEIVESQEEDLLEITISDDGKGMSKELKCQAIDPFTTTKTKKNQVGLGLPLFRQIALECDGDFKLHSQEEAGTEVIASFRRSHIDRPPLGDIASTLTSIIAGHPGVSLTYIHRTDEGRYSLKTTEVRSELEEVPLNHPQVLDFVRRDVEEGLSEIRPGEYVSETQTK